MIFTERVERADGDLVPLRGMRPVRRLSRAKKLQAPACITVVPRLMCASYRHCDLSAYHELVGDLLAGNHFLAVGLKFYRDGHSQRFDNRQLWTVASEWTSMQGAIRPADANALLYLVTKMTPIPLRSGPIEFLPPKDGRLRGKTVNSYAKLVIFALSANRAPD